MSSTNDSKRRYFSPAQKVALVKQHLIDGISVSDLCDQASD
ncbi:MAG: hypothetical protein ACKVH8_13720 [Pirellulales bacterium]